MGLDELVPEIEAVAQLPTFHERVLAASVLLNERILQMLQVMTDDGGRHDHEDAGEVAGQLIAALTPVFAGAPPSRHGATQPAQLANLLLGMLIYIMVLFVCGREYLPISNATYGIHPSKTLVAAGVQEGDRIISIDGVAPKTTGEAGKAIMIDDARTMVVERNGVQVTIALPEGLNQQALAAGEKEIMAVRLPFYIDSILPGGAAAKTSLSKGDRVLSVNGKQTLFFEDFRKTMQEEKGKEVAIAVLRGSDTLTVNAQVDAEGKVGLGPMTYKKLAERGAGFATVKEEYGFFASIPAGINYGLETLGGYVRSLKLLFTKSGAEQIGGFGAIGNMFPSEWDWNAFWNMTAFLSIILAFMNILPIPALDGGHVLFLIYEMIAGKPAPQRVMEVAQMVGMILLFGLILFANGNDIFKGITGRF